MRVNECVFHCFVHGLLLLPLIIHFVFTRRRIGITRRALELTLIAIERGLEAAWACQIVESPGHSSIAVIRIEVEVWSSIGSITPTFTLAIYMFIYKEKTMIINENVYLLLVWCEKLTCLLLIQTKKSLASFIFSHFYSILFYSMGGESE